MTKLNPSPQQQAVIDFLFSPAKKSISLVVEATAGSGKTTAILEAAHRSGDPTTLLCAFNRRIADELIERLSQRALPRGRMIKAQTLHGIGLSIVNHHENVKLDRDATDQLVREVVPSSTFPTKRSIVRSVRYVKETCSEWDNSIELTELLSFMNFVEDNAEVADVVLGVQEVMRASKAYRPVIDFCDMIWRPYALNLMPKGRYKTVIVDEAQDLSRGQFFLIERLVAPGGRLVLVGDLRQEIYEWRGAVGEDIWKIMRDKHLAEFLPLTWSFRCSRAVIREARAIVPIIEPRPDAPDGKVDMLPMTEALKQIAVGDFFLSRTNAGAVTAAIRAHLRGAVVRVLGGYDELEPLLQLLGKLDVTSLERFNSSLDEWKAKELDKDNLTDAQASRVEDRHTLLIEAARLVAPAKIAQVLRGIFRPSSQPAAIFSTVHKAKGLEAPRVFLLRATFERHKLKRDGEKKELWEVPFEEQNVEYVAITRAIDHLTWVIADSAWEVETLDDKIHKTIDDHLHGFGNFDPDHTTKEDLDVLFDLGVVPPLLGVEEP